MTLPEDTILENRYRIDKLLAHGGMGAIYRGYDANLDIHVAIKENFFQTPQSIRQFEQEARILARLRHLNLPRVIHHFNFDDQQYLVMDYVDGLDLWELVKREKYPLPERQALDYLIQICDAVQYLHDQHPPIIHRDIKPQNIKITAAGQAMLVDFGIAKVGDSDTRTRTGAQGVTPGFSPPEQYSKAGTTPRSDIYALGATLYAVLTGKKPPDSVILLVDKAKFIPPNQLNFKLTDRVSAAIIYAMQPQLQDRPPSVDVWRKELEQILDSLPATILDEPGRTVVSTVLSPTSPETPALTRQTEPPKRNIPWLWLGLGLVGIIALVSAITFFVMTGGEDSLDTPVVGQTETVASPATGTSTAAQGATATAQDTTQPQVDMDATVAAAVQATATKQAQATDIALAATSTEQAVKIEAATGTAQAALTVLGTKRAQATKTPTAIPTAIATPTLTPVPTNTSPPTATATEVALASTCPAWFITPEPNKAVFMIENHIGQELFVDAATLGQNSVVAAKQGEESGKLLYQLPPGRHDFNLRVGGGFGHVGADVQAGQILVAPVFFSGQAEETVYDMEIPEGCPQR